MNANLSTTKKVLASLFIATASLMSAQEQTENVKLRPIGLGLKFSVFGAEDLNLTSSISGGKTFFVSVNAHKNFRIEPHVGFSKSTTPGSNGVGDLNDKTTSLGGSMFYMFQKGQANFYFGPTYTGIKSIYDTEEYVWSPGTGSGSIKKVTKESKHSSIGLIIGSEYFFGRHFSLGAEVGCTSVKTRPDITNTTESEAFYTTGNLTVRTYF